MFQNILRKTLFCLTLILGNLKKKFPVIFYKFQKVLSILSNHFFSLHESDPEEWPIYKLHMALYISLLNL